MQYLPDMQYLINIGKVVLDGGKVTLLLFAITIVLSIPLGLVVALARISKIKLLSSATSVYIWIARGTPLLLQLFFIFYGLPNLGIVFPRFQSAVIGFVLNYAAYFAEIFRAGIQSIDKGQYEGADVLGLTQWQTMRRIILPQVISRILPPVGNEAITLVKDTALIYVIGIGEALRAAKNAVTRDFTISPFFVAAAFYLIMTLILTFVFKKLEQKYALKE